MARHQRHREWYHLSMAVARPFNLSVSKFRGPANMASRTIRASSNEIAKVVRFRGTKVEGSERRVLTGVVGV